MGGGYAAVRRSHASIGARGVESFVGKPVADASACVFEVVGVGLRVLSDIKVHDRALHPKIVTQGLDEGGVGVRLAPTQQVVDV